MNRRATCLSMNLAKRGIWSKIIWSIPCTHVLAFINMIYQCFTIRAGSCFWDLNICNLFFLRSFKDIIETVYSWTVKISAQYFVLTIIPHSTTRPTKENDLSIFVTKGAKNFIFCHAIPGDFRFALGALFGLKHALLGSIYRQPFLYCILFISSHHRHSFAKVIGPFWATLLIKHVLSRTFDDKTFLFDKSFQKMNHRIRAYSVATWH